MKKLIITAVIVLFTLSASATEKPIKPSESLRTDIIQLLGTESPFALQENQHTIHVIFTVTSKNEIIVLHADTPNPEMANFIKNKLNYKKVNLKEHKVGELFLLPVTFKKH